MRKYWLGIDVRKKWVHFLPNCDERNAATLKDPRKNSPAGTIHRVDRELELGFAD